MSENYLNYDSFTFEEQQKYIWGRTQLNTLLIRAYNILFDENVTSIGGEIEYNNTVIMNNQQKESLNKLIEKSLFLSGYAFQEQYTLEYIAQLIQREYVEYARYFIIGLSKYLYDNLSLKENYTKYLEKTKTLKNSVWYIPTQMKSENRKKFKKTFGGYQEQLCGASVYYLMNFVINALKNNNIEEYGALIMSCEYLLRIGEYNKKAKTNAKKERKTSEENKRIYQLWRDNIAGISIDDDKAYEELTKLYKEHSNKKSLPFHLKTFKRGDKKGKLTQFTKMLADEKTRS